MLDADWDVQAGGSAFSWQYLHQGGRFDVTSGLYHFRFRDYLPSLGRWTSLDPLSYAAGDANLYRYLGNGPVNAVDPNGLQEPGERAFRAGLTLAGLLHRHDDIEKAYYHYLENMIKAFRTAAAKNNVDPKVTQQILDAALSTPRPYGRDPCKRWVRNAMGKMPPRTQFDEVRGAPKLFVREVAWMYEPCWENLWCLGVDGHFAIQVRFPDGQVFYFDVGNWGGIFQADRIPRYAS